MLKKNELNIFSYKSVAGKISEREAYIFSIPQNFYLAYELSEFSEEDKKVYIGALDEIYVDIEEQLKEAINELGLKHNYRKFLSGGVTK